ncbi:hypothetical protein FNV43_RR02622 [Rhamnella rubrinervis]|uniref:Uncharacterized protein n=1 Tax=Rhamnella rubrinervis TaxID=2594499 RepID=A0A8K0HSG6_9ROSA|nr:hypothetical protein FNV43_RR02622 [Rhamnella rubrinervis]
MRLDTRKLSVPLVPAHTGRRNPPPLEARRPRQHTSDWVQALIPPITPPTGVPRSGNYSTQFVSEIDVIVRCHAPLHLKNWTYESFEFNEDVVTMSALNAQMRKSFKIWRYKLYERVKRSENEKDIAAIKPEHITEEKWMIFLNHMNSEDFQEENENELRESTSLSEDEIFVEVLSSKSIAFIGIGVLSKPNKL